MAKQIKLQRHKHAVKVASELPCMDDPYNMLKSKELREKIKECITNLEQSFTEDAAKLLTAYCTAHIVYRNSQRSGVIENIKVEEYLNKGMNKKGKPIIQCLDHKTGSDGPAQLVISKLTDQLLKKYYRLVRIKITPQKDCEEYHWWWSIYTSV